MIMSVEFHIWFSYGILQMRNLAAAVVVFACWCAVPGNLGQCMAFLESVDLEQRFAVWCAGSVCSRR